MSLVIIADADSVSLASKVCTILGSKLEAAVFGSYSDGEKHVEVKANVRNKDVCIIKSFCRRASDSLVELMFLTDALRNKLVRNIIVVCPLICYSRQDRYTGLGTALALRVIANTITHLNINKVITLDLHSEQAHGFFGLPIEILSALPVFAEDILARAWSPSTVIVSPDSGGSVRARRLARKLRCGLVSASKIRPQANVALTQSIEGEVQDRNCVIVDDVIDTCGTLISLSRKLRDLGAARISAYATHPILSKPHHGKDLNCVDEITSTDTVSLPSNCFVRPRIISVASMIAEALLKGCITQ